MHYRNHPVLSICVRCFKRQQGIAKQNNVRFSAQSRHLPQQELSIARDENEKDRIEEEAEMHQELGRMTERLLQMTEQSVEQDRKAARKAMDEAGFSDDLKRRLEERIQDSKFRSENAAAFAEVNMRTSAGKGTREQAAAQAWAGEESVGDAALRMLNDAHKPIRRTGPPKIPQPRAPSISVDMRMKKAVQKSKGERLANTRDRISVYALSQDPSLSETEREEMRKVLKERFTSGGRPMPSSLQGLAALANERIEDAIGRGQFKNIPKGKGIGVERDHNADSPFLDTTEYFMNKMIKKQEIVPPWIEKQQELVKSAAHFRGRLRHDWKRHAARVIASAGGSLDDQVKRGEAYMAAEAALNPRTSKQEALSQFDAEGKISQITITETPNSSNPQSSQDTIVTISQYPPAEAVPPLQPPPSTSIFQTTSPSLPEPTPTLATPTQHSSELPETPQSPASSTATKIPPFRDPSWLALESPYHNLAIRDLNNLTRSYNLQAPSLAQKPYFSLDRELAACYADIAPQLPSAIIERARRPERARAAAAEVIGHRPGGMLDRFAGDRKVKIYDSQRPNYGFRDFWRDLWGTGAERKETKV